MSTFTRKPYHRLLLLSASIDVVYIAFFFILEHRRTNHITERMQMLNQRGFRGGAPDETQRNFISKHQDDRSENGQKFDFFVIDMNVEM